MYGYRETDNNKRKAEGTAMYIVHIVIIENNIRKAYKVSAISEKTARALLEKNNKNNLSWIEKK